MSCLVVVPAVRRTARVGWGRAECTAAGRGGAGRPGEG